MTGERPPQDSDDALPRAHSDVSKGPTTMEIAFKNAGLQRQAPAEAPAEVESSPSPRSFEELDDIRQQKGQYLRGLQTKEQEKRTHSDTELEDLVSNWKLRFGDFATAVLALNAYGADKESIPLRQAAEEALENLKVVEGFLETKRKKVDLLFATEEERLLMEEQAAREAEAAAARKAAEQAEAEEEARKAAAAAQAEQAARQEEEGKQVGSLINEGGLPLGDETDTSSPVLIDPDGSMRASLRGLDQAITPTLSTDAMDLEAKAAGRKGFRGVMDSVFARLGKGRKQKIPENMLSSVANPDGEQPPAPDNSASGQEEQKVDPQGSETPPVVPTDEKPYKSEMGQKLAAYLGNRFGEKGKNIGEMLANAPEQIKKELQAGKEDIKDWRGSAKKVWASMKAARDFFTEEKKKPENERRGAGEAFALWYGNLAPRHRIAMSVALAGTAGIFAGVGLVGATSYLSMLGVGSGSAGLLALGQRALGSAAVYYKAMVGIKPPGANLSSDTKSHEARGLAYKKVQGDAFKSAMFHFGLTTVAGVAVGGAIGTAAFGISKAGNAGAEWLASMTDNTDKLTDEPPVPPPKILDSAPIVSRSSSMFASESSWRPPASMVEVPPEPPRYEPPSAEELYPPPSPASSAVGPEAPKAAGPSAGVEAAPPVGTASPAEAPDNRPLPEKKVAASTRAAGVEPAKTGAPEVPVQAPKVADITLKPGDGYTKGVERLYEQLKGKQIDLSLYPDEKSDIRQILAANDTNIKEVAFRIAIKHESEVFQGGKYVPGAKANILQIGKHLSIGEDGKIVMNDPTPAEKAAIAKVQNAETARIRRVLSEVETKPDRAATIQGRSAVELPSAPLATAPVDSADVAAPSQPITEPPSRSAAASAAETARPSASVPAENPPPFTTYTTSEGGRIISEPLPAPEYPATTSATNSQTGSPRVLSRQSESDFMGPRTFFTTMWNEAIDPKLPAVYEIQDKVTGEKSFFAHGGTDAQRNTFVQEELFRHPEKYEGKPIRWAKELPSILGPRTTMSEMSVVPGQPGVEIGFPDKPLPIPVPGDSRWQFLRKVL